jgi:hypothetical protein
LHSSSSAGGKCGPVRWRFDDRFFRFLAETRVLVTDPSARMVSQWIVPFAAVGDDVELPCVASLRRRIMMAPRIPFSSRLVGMGQLSEPEGPVSEKEESLLPKS